MCDAAESNHRVDQTCVAHSASARHADGGPSSFKSVLAEATSKTRGLLRPRIWTNFDHHCIATSAPSSAGSLGGSLSTILETAATDLCVQGPLVAKVSQCRHRVVVEASDLCIELCLRVACLGWPRKGVRHAEVAVAAAGDLPLLAGQSIADSLPAMLRGAAHETVWRKPPAPRIGFFAKLPVGSTNSRPNT